MSGIFGAYSVKNQPVLEEVYLGLYALQHRGQESAGIAWAHDGHAASARGFGLLHNAIDQHKLSLENANCAIGHVRYVPLESSQLHNVLPVCANYARGPIAIAHDGLVTNVDSLKSQLEARGAIFQSATNSEAILHMVAQKSHMEPVDAIVDALKRLEGSYAIAVLLEDALVAARDPYGFKPLVLGERDGTYYAASESCALDIVGAKLLRDVEPGARPPRASLALHALLLRVRLHGAPGQHNRRTLRLRSAQRDGPPPRAQGSLRERGPRRGNAGQRNDIRHRLRAGGARSV